MKWMGGGGGYAFSYVNKRCLLDKWEYKSWLCLEEEREGEDALYCKLLSKKKKKDKTDTKQERQIEIFNIWKIRFEE